MSPAPTLGRLHERDRTRLIDAARGPSNRDRLGQPTYRSLTIDGGYDLVR
jgi:hypothetical protein